MKRRLLSILLAVSVLLGLLVIPVSAGSTTPEDGFFKCHRSYLVYLPNVDHFTPSEITSKSGKTIPIARGCSKAFKEAYFAQMFQNS